MNDEFEEFSEKLEDIKRSVLDLEDWIEQNSLKIKQEDEDDLPV